MKSAIRLVSFRCVPRTWVLGTWLLILQSFVRPSRAHYWIYSGCDYGFEVCPPRANGSEVCLTGATLPNNISTAEECDVACGVSSSGCQFFTYDNARKVCKLKSSGSERYSELGMVKDVNKVSGWMDCTGRGIVSDSGVCYHSEEQLNTMEDNFCHAAKDNYCRLNASHTMCEYCGVNWVDCRSVCDRADPFTQSEKDAIVDSHNALRRRIANGEENGGAAADGRSSSALPTASNMNKLIWDEELAAIAQKWIDQCTFDHDTNRFLLNETDTKVGQNIIWGNRQEPNRTEISQLAVNNWYAEVRNFSASGVGSYETPDEDTPNRFTFTQLVWAETKRVGCGLIIYDEGRESLFGCNYAPGGNVAGQPVYQSGPVGSSCSAGQEDGLCL